MSTTPQTPRDNPSTPSWNGTYIGAWKAVAIIFAIAFAVSITLEIQLEGHALSHALSIDAIAGGLGAATAVSLIPILVIVISRLVQRRSRPTNTPIRVGAVIFLVLLAMTTCSRIAVHDYECKEGIRRC
jgi:hypothetical protein